jgi:metallo-beta-lactamase class B
MRRISIAFLFCAPLLAQQAPRVWTIQELFTRNVGTTQQQDKQFAAAQDHRQRLLRRNGDVVVIFDHDAARAHSHQLDLRAKPADNSGLHPEVGFKFEDIKILLGSHAHGDHMEGDGLITKLTGARAMAMAEDIPPLQAMRSPGGNPRPEYEVLHDGSEVKLGNVTLTAHLTPGHTPGCTTWTMKVQEGGKSYDLLIIGSVGVNPGTNLVGNPQLVAQYQQSLKFLRSAHVDVPLGSHPAMYNLNEKYPKLSAGGRNPFIDPESFQAEVTIQETAFNNELKRQQVEGPPPPRGGGRRGQD